MIRPRLPAPVALALWALAAGPGAGTAQENAFPPVLTLRTWADGVWLALLDREGAFHGRLSDHGIFQRFNPLEDHEYRLDLHTGLFSPAEDAAWAARPDGFRGAAASISHPHIVQRADWNGSFPVSGAWELDMVYLREHDLTALRDYLRPGVAWRPDGPWGAYATLGMHFFKPAADVEVGAARRWSQADGGGGWADVRLGFVDAFSNLIFNVLGVDPDDEEAHLDYRTLPLALRADGEWRRGAVRVEGRGGVSRRSLVRVTFPATGEPAWDLRERVAFAGGALDWQAGERTALAARATWALAESERLLEVASPLDLDVREETRTAGVSARRGLGGPLGIEVDLLATWRPEDRRAGWRFPAGPTPPEVRHRDRELFGMAALVRRPVAGWSWRLAWAAVGRAAGVLAPDLTAVNHRLVMDGGRRFPSGFEVTAGLRWDLDAFRERFFDGAQLRLRTGPLP